MKSVPYRSRTILGIPHLIGFAGFHSKDAIIEAAYAALSRALRIATAMQMPFDEAEAHEALARLGGRWPALRRRPPGLDAAAIAGHLATAQALYERLGAAWHVSALAALSARPAG